jgi:uroporphyrinogen decarboxylase
MVALWSGDDMGFKTATLISPQHLREYILPWHRRYAEIAHAQGKPYILHSCGNLREIMPDLVEDVRIDAKHSFEDAIQPVEDFHRLWHGQVAAIGGLDVDLLARGTEADVVRRTESILAACAPRGGYAAGSGNTVTNYVPVDNYLAMVETVHRYNGRA